MIKFFSNSNMKRRKIVDALASVRREWEGESESLIDIESSAGLLLHDVAMALGLAPAECIDALGAELVQDVESLLDGQVVPTAVAVSGLAVASDWVKEF